MVLPALRWHELAEARRGAPILDIGEERGDGRGNEWRLALRLCWCCLLAGERAPRPVQRPTFGGGQRVIHRGERRAGAQLRGGLHHTGRRRRRCARFGGQERRGESIFHGHRGDTPQCIDRAFFMQHVHVQVLFRALLHIHRLVVSLGRGLQRRRVCACRGRTRVNGGY